MLDNLERAIGAAQQAGETGPLVQGVAMVQTQFLDVLKRHGITPHRRPGQAVRPEPAPGGHAAAQPPTSTPNTVLQVLEQGFMIHDRVLRPAKVIVSSSAVTA